MAALKHVSSRGYRRLAWGLASGVAAILFQSVAAVAGAAASSGGAPVIMPPDTVWIIERGVYAGTTVVLRLDAALSSRFRGEHFWRVASPGSTDRIVGWRTTRYPIPVAFRQASGVGAVSPGDSATFWSALDEMNVELGMTVFTPATVSGVADPEEIIVVDVRVVANADGLSRASWTSSGELFDVRVTFRDQSVLRDRHTVMHEMMHALGFGHTREWTSVVNPVDAGRPSRLTPEECCKQRALPFVMFVTSATFLLTHSSAGHTIAAHNKAAVRIAAPNSPMEEVDGDVGEGRKTGRRVRRTRIPV